MEGIYGSRCSEPICRKWRSVETDAGSRGRNSRRGLGKAEMFRTQMRGQGTGPGLAIAHWRSAAKPQPRKEEWPQRTQKTQRKSEDLPLRRKEWRGHNPLLFIRHVPLRKRGRTPPNSPTLTNTKNSTSIRSASLPAADVFPSRKAFHTPVENLVCNSSL